MTTQILSNALFTKTQQRVLGLLYGAPGKSFYTNEIVRIAAVGRGTVTRELVKLAAAGVLTVAAAGNQKHYQANPDCPVYAELTRIARKLFEVEITQPRKSVKVKAGTPKKAVRVKAGTQQPVKEHPQSPPVVKQEAPIAVAKSPVKIIVDDKGQLGLF